MKKLLLVIAVLILLALGVLIGMLWFALALAVGSAWFFSMPWHTGWHLAWEKPWLLLLWGILFEVGIAGAASSSS